MDPTPLLRTSLLYIHLLLCAFALHRVLSTDWQLLRGRISARALQTASRHIAWLFAALWFTGLALIAVDTGFDTEVIAQRPKLVAKLLAVLVLTANGLLLNKWCLPRLVSERPLGRGEAALLMCSGALSTASWLVAAFYGVARALTGWAIEHHLALYGAVVAIAMMAALPLAGRLHEGRAERAKRLRQGQRLPRSAAPPAAVARQAA
ncbi:conserved membrane hypothetical protein [Rubrivivax sp. A210]|uniref:hypothetical protein n=1 Tax=Rubrivivax sp. A210 TaxID=2772301 RepID=UPI00191A5EB7|nr:hypothetical protein [Rubrivivax sp. A210]CAD5374377.1 conserved membrane hypothetical protein [Rubrivivax sp. A210]